MPKAELEDGLPRAILERDDLLDALQTRYGNFAIAVLFEVKGVDPSAPDDILTFGENWCQLAESRDHPKNDLERMFHQQGVEFFGDMWPIRGRIGNKGILDGIFELIAKIQEGVKAGTLNDRILKKLAVLDLTSMNPPLREQDLSQRTDTPWGVNGILRGTKTLIYHITCGFARQQVVDVNGNPGDDLSASIYLRDRKKW